MTDPVEEACLQPMVLEPIIYEAGTCENQELEVPVFDHVTEVTENPMIGFEGGIAPLKCTNCGSKRKEPKWKKVEDPNRRQSKRLVIKNFKLPFEELPLDCKLHIFSYLDIFEKGAVCMVSTQWRSLAYHSSSWSYINLRLFSLCSHQKQHIKCPRTCQPTDAYNRYMRRLSAFYKTLSQIKPNVRTFIMTADIDETKNEPSPWLRLIIKLLESFNRIRLTYIDIDWTVSPYRPSTLDRYCCLITKVRSSVRHHEDRLKQFLSLLKYLTKRLPGLLYLTMPFHWSNISLGLLCKFRHLQKLNLKHYFSFKPLPPQFLTVLLLCLPRLTDLTLAVVNATFQTRHVYRVRHPNLQSLDITHCTGFFIRDMDLPALKNFSVKRNPWQGYLVNPNFLPCLYDVLKRGAPELHVLNKCRLYPYWKEFLYLDLDAALKHACPCVKHAT
ncbi:unnamed protein product [Owenia fusiformis]|uniref:Uncharacterized protein n=1 Tax=Owenia fusiformis TaxID=6347 RepID=A0A8J1Y7Q4_OWEFU|nr:unnamed protein product [Owenia fusiformis]